MNLATTIWRTSRGGSKRSPGVYHLSKDCPVAFKGRHVIRGRLGAMLAQGRVLCHYEARRGMTP